MQLIIIHYEGFLWTGKHIAASPYGIPGAVTTRAGIKLATDSTSNSYNKVGLGFFCER
jgi:hypothetical protein